jgi:hypothetical protein
VLPQLLAGQAAFSAGSNAVGLFDPGESTGFVGWPDVAMSLGRLVVRVELRQRKRDSDALSEMIETARGLVPVDTGRLLSGITGENFETYSEFRASAVHEGGGADYARFVEFGTRAGEASVASPISAHEGFFASDQFGETGMRGVAIVKNRRSRRTHGGTAAQPYFFPAANKVLGNREEEAIAQLPYDAADDDIWEIG